MPNSCCTNLEEVVAAPLAPPPSHVRSLPSASVGPKIRKCRARALITPPFPRAFLTLGFCGAENAELVLHEEEVVAAPADEARRLDVAAQILLHNCGAGERYHVALNNDFICVRRPRILAIGVYPSPPLGQLGPSGVTRTYRTAKGGRVSPLPEGGGASKESGRGRPIAR